MGDQDITVPRETLLKIGAELVAERKAAVEAAGDGDAPADMLACMIIANNTLPVNQRLSDDVLVAREFLFPISSWRATFLLDQRGTHLGRCRARKYEVTVRSLAVSSRTHSEF